MGLLRNPVARPWRIFRARRLCNGHVSDAPDRRARRLWQSGTAGLHGVSQLEGTAMVLDRVRAFLVRGTDGRCGAVASGIRLWLAGLQEPCHRGLPVDHHAGDDLCADARILPQQYGLRWQQRADRLQGDTRLRHCGGHYAGRVVCGHGIDACTLPCPAVSRRRFQIWKDTCGGA